MRTISNKYGINVLPLSIINHLVYIYIIRIEVIFLKLSITNEIIIQYLYQFDNTMSMYSYVCVYGNNGLVYAYYGLFQAEVI